MKKFLYFSAPWCGPCKMLAPVMEELAKEITIEKIDVSTDAETTVKYNVLNVPTVILLRDEQEVTRTVGANSKNYYINQYNEN